MSRTVSSSSTATTRPQQSTPGSMPTMPQGAQLPREKVAARAYEKWVQRGRPQSGTDLQDWLEAEAELKAEQNRSSGSGNSTLARR